MKDANELWLQVGGDGERFRTELENDPRQPLVSVSSFNTPPSDDTRFWTIRTGAELASLEFSPLASIPLLGQSGFLFRGCAHLLVSHPKVDKTQVILHSARQWLEQGLCVAILYEESEPLMSNRLKSQPALQALASEHIYFVKLNAPLNDRVLRALDAELNADIYVVDTARAFLPIRNENDNAELASHHYALVNANQAIGKTLIMLHHAPQELPTKVALRSAGGLATAGAYDMVIAIAQVQQGDDTRCRVEAEGRLAPHEPFEFQWSDGDLVLQAITPYRVRVRNAVLQAPIQLHNR